MAFLDNVSKKITQAGQGALQKTKDMADVARLNGFVAEEEKRLNNYYYQIGKLYAQLHSSDCEEAFVPYIGAVNDSLKKIDGFKTEIQSLRSVASCPKCGAEVSSTSSFCNACGTAIPKAPEIIPADCVKCANCGGVVNKNMRFCTSCGNPMAQMSEQPAVAPQPASAPIPQPAPVPVSPVQQPAYVPPVQQSAPVYEEQPVAAGMRCPNCGAALAEDSFFCTECGTRL